MTNTLIVSTCGTSSLTNRAGDRAGLLHRTSNAAEGQVPAEDHAVILDWIDQRRREMAEATPDQAKALSAELNGILTYQAAAADSSAAPPAGPPDHHLLVVTPTWLGETAAGLIAGWLEAHGQSAEPRVIPDLVTDDPVRAQSGLADLARSVQAIAQAYRDRGYRVVFNLTGGFKLVQGFLQTLGTFTADECVYIYQGASPLLRIPRLPVRFSPDDVLRTHVDLVRRLALGLPVAAAELSALPETLTLTLDGANALSGWGETLWIACRDDVYGEGLLPSPSPQVRIADAVVRAARGLERDRRLELNRRIDDLARFMERPDRPNPDRLAVRPVRAGAMLPSTHEANAWSDKDAQRLYLHFDGAVCHVDRLDAALHG